MIDLVRPKIERLIRVNYHDACFWLDCAPEDLVLFNVIRFKSEHYTSPIQVVRCVHPLVTEPYTYKEFLNAIR